MKQSPGATRGVMTVRYLIRPFRRRRLLIVGAAALATLCAVYASFPKFSHARGDARVGAAHGLAPSIVAQSLPLSRGRALARLSMQPEANEMRRRLGRRFLTPGIEVTTMAGVLTIGSQNHVVAISRIQDDDTERVSIGIDGGAESLTWDGLNGAISGSVPAGGSDRSMAERLALDSPDQFVLAQLRGASYYTIARNVMPQEAGGAETYSGPVWNVVRVGEPGNASGRTAMSAARLFHINRSTGLIDRVYSQENGSTVMAEVSGWAANGTELDPTRITWKQGGQVLMELTITGAIHSAKQ